MQAITIQPETEIRPVNPLLKIAAHLCEVQRLLTIHRRNHIHLNRKARTTLEILTEACVRMVLAVERLDVGDGAGKLLKAVNPRRKQSPVTREEDRP